MTVEQRLKLLTDFSMQLANQQIVPRAEVEIALDNYFDKLERQLPLVLLVPHRNDPPPSNWRAMWRAYGA